VPQKSAAALDGRPKTVFHTGPPRPSRLTAVTVSGMCLDDYHRSPRVFGEFRVSDERTCRMGRTGANVKRKLSFALRGRWPLEITRKVRVGHDCWPTRKCRPFCTHARASVYVTRTRSFHTVVVRLSISVRRSNFSVQFTWTSDIVARNWIPSSPSSRKFNTTFGILSPVGTYITNTPGPAKGALTTPPAEKRKKKKTPTRNRIFPSACFYRALTASVGCCRLKNDRTYFTFSTPGELRRRKVKRNNGYYAEYLWPI